MSEREERPLLAWHYPSDSTNIVSGGRSRTAVPCVGWSNSSMPVSRMKRYWHMKPNQVMPRTGQDAGFVSREAMLADLAERSGNAANHPHGSPLSHSPRLNNPLSAIIRRLRHFHRSSDNATESKLVAWQR